MKELAASSIVLVHNIIYNIYIYSIKQYYINYTLQHNTVCIKNYDCKLKLKIILQTVTLEVTRAGM